MNDFPAPPVVIRRSKRLGFILVVVTGLPLLLALHQHLYNPTWNSSAGVGSLTGPLEFLVVFLLGILFLLRPARLTLTPEGLTYERLLRFWQRSWRWHETSPFAWQEVGTGKNKRYAIVFTSGAEYVEVPAYWELPSDEVLELLNHARSGWNGSAAVTGISFGENAPATLVPPAQPDTESQSTVEPRHFTTTDLMLWLLAPLLIGAGSLVDYLFGYKDSLFIEGSYMLLIIFGWLWLLIAAIAALPGTAKTAKRTLRPVSMAGRLRHRLGQAGYAAAFLGWLTLLVGNLVVVDQQRNERVAQILATEPTATAVATVTQLRERGSRSGTFRATVLTYQAGPEQVSQALPEIGRYAVGQRLRVKYAVAHPDMFIVAE